MDREAVRGSREGRHLKSRQRVVVIIVVMSWSSSSSVTPHKARDAYRLLLHTLIVYTAPRDGTPPTPAQLRLLHPLAAGSTLSPSLMPDGHAPSLDS